MKTFLWKLMLKAIDIFVKVVITAIARGIIARCSNKHERAPHTPSKRKKRGSRKSK
jgi:hypothetical protein